MLGGLRSDVQQGAARGPALPRRVPRGRRQRVVGVEAGQRGDKLVGVLGRVLVLGEDACEGLVRQQPEAVGQAW